MKDVVSRLLERPTVLMLVAGIMLLVLASAEKIGFNNQSVSVVDPVWRIGLAVVGVALIGTGAVIIVQDIRNPRPARPYRFRYDVFLASPMAALNGPAYQQQRQQTLRIKEALQARAEVKDIYDAGDKLTQGAWDPKDAAAEDDLTALKDSRHFILLYPEKLASSVLFEAGYALAMGKPGIYIVRDSKDLPYLMQELNNLSRSYPQVRIWQCPDTDAIVERINRAGLKMFKKDQES